MRATLPVNPKSRKHISNKGFSLMEVLLIISMLSLTILPYTLVVGQLGTNARGGHIQSSRSLVMNSLLAEMNPERNNFTSTFTDASKNSYYTESGQALPFMRKVDVTTAGATNSMKRTVNLYLYNNASDADSAAYYKNRVVLSTDNIRLRAGNSSDLIDSSNFFWFTDHNLLYSSANKRPGPISNYGYDGVSAGDITNTTGNDDELYKRTRLDPTMSYSFDVDNGPYTVKLYFAENYNAINSTTNRRLTDITIEGSRMNVTPYSAMETMGAYARANVRMYDTVVSDGVLNITISKDAASFDPQVPICAIQILKRDL